ncbi:hypothetical protein OU994_13010 [Pseudoduganella sp. SL102]|uniref:hypothetical protein n=1 Tax=Pseudoduganella sp. SL102 TaxID=2995154 RepID=UPI00248CB718|nr:hypothetical protein [Pseudoduganella sp. SL102]WBS05125.1 hypothetical protein OU994_13010 [Pseudoduganella sp. SL102]
MPFPALGARHFTAPHAAPVKPSVRVAEDIGKLPDRSVTEVLQCVVGVMKDRRMAGDPAQFTVECSGLKIRGQTYVRSELNVRDSLSANGGRSLKSA